MIGFWLVGINYYRFTLRFIIRHSRLSARKNRRPCALRGAAFKRSRVMSSHKDPKITKVHQELLVNLCVLRAFVAGTDLRAWMGRPSPFFICAHLCSSVASFFFWVCPRTQWPGRTAGRLRPGVGTSCHNPTKPLAYSLHSSNNH